MRQLSRVLLGLAAASAVSGLFSGCGSNPENAVSSAAAGGSSGASGAAGSGVGAGTGGSFQLDLDGATDHGMVELGDACAANLISAELVPLDLYLMLDISGSMLEPTPDATSTTSKWDAVKSALISFLQDSKSAGLGVGLQYFPLRKPGVPASCSSDAACGTSGPCFLKHCWQYFIDSGGYIASCSSNGDCGAEGPCVPIAECQNNTGFLCRTPGQNCGTDPNGVALGACQAITSNVCLNATSCDVTAYATPAQPIATLPGAAGALVGSINAQTPDGQTPTAPALSGALQEAQSWAQAHAGHRVAAVLATDGLPTECTPTDIPSIAALAATGASATPAIQTFVIGVFGPADTGAQSNLDQIATAGGTQGAFIVDTSKDVAAQFLSALDAIRGTTLGCQFQIPAPSNNQSLNYNQVNVQLTSAGTATTLLYVAGQANCDPTSGGWYYDHDPSDPSQPAPTQIEACPASCTAIQAAQSGSIAIALGCDTLIR